MPKKSRKQRKQQREKMRNKLINQGYSAKEVKSFPNKELEKVVSINIPQSKGKNLGNVQRVADRREKDRIRAQQRREKLRSQRLEKLELISQIVGVSNPTELNHPNAKTLDKIKLEDLKSGKYKRTDFSELIPSKDEEFYFIQGFDFEKVYQVPAGKKLHFAFRSLNGERDISEELERFSRYSNEELLSFLKTIKEMPETRSQNVKGKKGRNIGSSGQAGEGMIKMSSQPALQELYNRQRNEDRRGNNYDKLRSKVAKKKGINYQHSGIDYHWQTIRQADENGRAKAYTEITPRKLLIIGNAILWNVTEYERGGLYNQFYSICCDVIPEMKNILP